MLIAIRSMRCTMGRLDESRLLTLQIGKGDYEKRLHHAQRRLVHLRLDLGGQMGSGELGPGPAGDASRAPDAGGKGGAIKRIVEPLDPRHYRVSTYAKPTPDEKRHHFLWRFYRDIPGMGGMARVRPQLVRPRARRAVGGVRHDRAVDAGLRRDPVRSSSTLVLEGMILVKFWLHLSAEEQLRRFERPRPSDPLRAVEADRRGLAQP